MHCQSCGMPMGSHEEQCGTHADGTSCTDYCGFCFEGGQFTEDVDMEQMVALCLPHIMGHNPEMNEEEAQSMMENLLPTLKRWKKS